MGRGEVIDLRECGCLIIALGQQVSPIHTDVIDVMRKLASLRVSAIIAEVGSKYYHEGRQGICYTLEWICTRGRLR